jgi:hypothetical protein
MRIWGKTMNKKILIGSIIAVSVLIGVSFTSVVGYRSGASDMKASPLFNIRSSRAIDEENRDLSCEYVGKGDNINLLIPNRDSKLELIQKAIIRISKMDNTTFNRFIGIVINRVPQELNINAVVSMFEKLRNNPIMLVNSDIFQKINADKQLDTYEYTMCDTICGSCPITEYNPIICLLGISLITIIILPFLLLGVTAGIIFNVYLELTLGICPSNFLLICRNT